MSAATPALLSLHNPLQQRLQRGELALSMILRMARGPEFAGIAASAGLHACYIDLEHSPLSLDMASGLCAWAREAGLTPLIRVAIADPVAVGRALDAGALGVIVPHVVDAATAAQVVASARFAPLGRRSWSSTQPLLRFAAAEPVSAQAALNAATLVVLMIESELPQAELEAIARVPGVNMLFIGAGDLCTDMGLAGQLRHPRVEALIDGVLRAALPQGVAVGVGGMAQDAEALQHWVERGVRFISIGNDIGFLLAGARQAVQRLKARA